MNGIINLFRAMAGMLFCALLTTIALSPYQVFGATVCGDVDGSSQVDVSDAFYLVNYVFNDGPVPADDAGGDINFDGSTNITDAVFLIQYIFGDGEPFDLCSIARRLTRSGGSQPTVSPDGDWIAFRSSTGLDKIRSDGTDQRHIIDTGVEPDWSHSDNLILYRNGSSLFVVELTSGTSKLVRTGGFDDGAVWMKHGTEIAAEGSNGIVIISYPHGSISDVPCDDPSDGSCQGEEPTWSPDGEFIAFEDGLEILKVRRVGGTAEQVVGNLRDTSFPAWSPDSKWIAFTMEGEHLGTYQIWVVDALGMTFGLKQVTFGSWQDLRPAWGPDSRTIYFQSNRGGQTEVWKVRFRP